MAGSIEFYFDFSSPYGYLAAEQIEAVAARHGRQVNWHPVLLGVVFKVTQSQPLTEIPLKREYAIKDFRRSAVDQGITYNAPSVFPIATQNAARAVLWLQQTDAAKAKQLALALYRAYFQQDRDISSAEVLADVASSLGIDAQQMMTAIQTDAIKLRLRQGVEAAIAAGVFGSPYFIVDGEPFWGADRLPMLDRWLSRGGWAY